MVDWSLFVCNLRSLDFGRLFKDILFSFCSCLLLVSLLLIVFRYLYRLFPRTKINIPWSHRGPGPDLFYSDDVLCLCWICFRCDVMFACILFMLLEFDKFASKQTVLNRETISSKLVTHALELKLFESHCIWFKTLCTQGPGPYSMGELLLVSPEITQSF